MVKFNRRGKAALTTGASLGVSEFQELSVLGFHRERPCELKATVKV
jgi:hypothetical protein